MKGFTGMNIKGVLKKAYRLADSNNEFERLSNKDQSLAWTSVFAMWALISASVGATTYGAVDFLERPGNDAIQAFNKRIDNTQITVSEKGWQPEFYTEGTTMPLDKIAGLKKYEQVKAYVENVINEEKTEIVVHPSVIEDVANTLTGQKKKPKDNAFVLGGLGGLATALLLLLFTHSSAMKTPINLSGSIGLIPAAIRRLREEKELTAEPS